MAKFSYHCLPFRQNSEAPLLCVFHAPASEVLQWAAIQRLPDVPKAPQRRLNDYKANAISRFLSDPRTASRRRSRSPFGLGSRRFSTQRGGALGAGGEGIQ